MARNEKGIVFRYEWLSVIKCFNETEGIEIVCSLLEYGKSGVKPDFSDKSMAIIFNMLAAQIDEDKQRYLETCNRNAENAKKRWAKEKQEDKNNYERIPSNTTEYESCDRIHSLPPNTNDAKHANKIKRNKIKVNKIKDNTLNTLAQSVPKEHSTQEGDLIISLQLNTGEEYPVYENQVKQWEDIYPGINVNEQLRAMKGWCIANPTKRKTRSGINRFINNWLSKEQNKPKTNKETLW